MAANDYQTDLKLTTTLNTSSGQNVRERVTLALSPSGDIATVQGRVKLSQQMLRAIVNDDIGIQGFLNSQNTRNISTLIMLTLRNFRRAQIFETEKSDPNLDGFIIYRYGANNVGDNFAQVSPRPITHMYTNRGLVNGLAYTYGLAKSTGNGLYTSPIIEKLEVTPTAFAHKQEVVIGGNFSAVPGDGQVTFYVDYSRIFLKSELLDIIENIEILEEENEPRRITINISIRDLDNNIVDIASQRFNIIT